MSATQRAAEPLFLVEESHDLPLCRVQITARTGAATDGAWGGEPLTGLCDFATELMRRGAGGRTRAQLDEAFEDLGASCHVSCTHDSVDFEVVALKEKLEPACALLGDVLLRPDDAEEEAEKLRRETLAQLDDARDDDGYLVRRFFSRAAYGAEHPYGRPVAALPQTLPLLTTERARAWRARYLVTGNVIVGGSGDLTEGELRGLYDRHFAGLPAGPLREAPVPEPPRREGLRVLLVDKPERTQTQLYLGHPGPRWDEDAWLPFSVAMTAFGGTFTSRLMDEVRVKRGLSYGASARVGSGRGRRTLVVHTFPAAEQTPETLSLLMKLLRDLGERGLSAEELAFARGYLARSHAFRVQTPEGRLATRVELELCGLPQDRLRSYPTRVQAVTDAQVAEALAALLRPRDLLLTLVGTEKQLGPLLRGMAELADVPIDVVAYDSY